MKINQIESRNMCNVCGQTPCNCTHLSEGVAEGSGKDAWAAGYQAFQDDVTKCPYAPGSDEASQWNLGWESAQARGWDKETLAEDEYQDLRKLQQQWWVALPDIMKKAGIKYQPVQELDRDYYPVLGTITFPEDQFIDFHVNANPKGDSAKINISIDVGTSNSLFRHSQPQKAAKLNAFAEKIAQALGGTHEGARMTGERKTNPGVGAVVADLTLPKEPAQWQNPSQGRYDPKERFLAQPGERARQGRVARSAYSDSFGGDASNYRFEEGVAEGSRIPQDWEVKSAVWRNDKQGYLAPHDVKSHFVRADRSRRAEKKASKEYEPGRGTWEIHPRGNKGVAEAEIDRPGMKDGRPYSDPYRRHPGNSSYMTPEYLIQKYKERLEQIAAGPYKRPKEVAQLQSRIAKLEKKGVAEAGVGNRMSDMSVGSPKIVYKGGKAVGEIGLDHDPSPGNGPYYMKHYETNTSYSGYDTKKEALAELKHCVEQMNEQDVAEGLPKAQDGRYNPDGSKKQAWHKDPRWQQHAKDLENDPKNIYGGVGKKKVKEQGVSEGAEERKRNALWAQITSYERRAKETKNDVKKQHLLKMADELRGKLPTTDEEKLAEALDSLQASVDSLKAQE